MESTPPSKSQPLHNFDLPNLKWNTDGNTSNSLHRRRPIKSPSLRPEASSASPVRRDSVSAPPPPRIRSPDGGDSAMKRSPVCGESLKPPIMIRKSSLVSGDPEGLSLDREGAGRQFRSGHSSTEEAEAVKKSKGNKDSNFFASGGVGVCSSGKEKTKKKKLPKETDEVDVAAGINTPKTLIKFPAANPAEENTQEEAPQIPNKGDAPQIPHKGGEIQADGETRTWDLRPRKPKLKNQNANANAPAKDEKSGGNELKRSGGGGDQKEKEKKEKRKLSICIPLSKAEIEEDIYALSGSKPARRPKKRAKNIQKNLDDVFPGLWLVSITPESYKVSENSLKG